MFAIIDQFFSGLRPKPAPRPVPVYVRLTRRVMTSESGLVFHPGTIGRVVDHYDGGAVVLLPGGVVVRVPVDSELVEVVG
jgi:hypothetical protein